MTEDRAEAQFGSSIGQETISLPHQMWHQPWSEVMPAERQMKRALSFFRPQAQCALVG